LRKAVGQARFCVANKLIRESKALRDKGGNEAQREMNNMRADKLINEVYALKTIKNDEISEFGILNERGLTEILHDRSSSSRDCVMARVVYYKTLNRRLMQFKERFPDYKKYMAKKKKKLKKKVVKTKQSKENNSKNKSSKKQKVISDKNVEQPQHNSRDEETCNNGPETRSNSRKRKKSLIEDCTSLEKQKLLKSEKDTSETMIIDRQSSVIKPSSVTKEAMVKKFAELLEKQGAKDAQTSVESQNSASTEQVKMVDDFFITANGQNYQGNSASTSYTKSHGHNTRAKAFQSNEIKKQNANRKNNTSFNKKYPGKQSFSMKSKKMISKINDGAKNKANENMTVNKRDNIDLHPSWMAKKKEQEIMKQGFQGKKIVFTDD